MLLRSDLSGNDADGAPAATRTMALELPAPSAPAATHSELPFEPNVPAGAGSAAAGDAPLAEQSTSSLTAPPAEPGRWETVTVAKGDNLSLIFGRLGLSRRDLHEIVHLDNATRQLKRIKPGQTIRFRIDERTLEEMIVEIDLMRSLHVDRTDDSFVAELREVEPEIRISSAHADIQSSVFLAGQREGLSDQLIMQMIEIFGWDIDFVLDIRVDDHYTIIFEEYFKDGEKLKDGRILAAEFINRDRQLRAVYFQDDAGHGDYYAVDGASMRKAFLRTPLNFTRISSRFNLRRRHPVLNTIRAHRGVDYAAPHGTPIKATGNGRIQFAGNKGGYGKVIEIVHAGQYTTLYAHMSRFARGMNQGNRVTQGQVIGYVGQSGLATGPHLHYEFRVNGVHRNPLTIPLPEAQPIADEYRNKFDRVANAMVSRLEEVATARAASTSVVAQLDDGALPRGADGSVSAPITN